MNYHVRFDQRIGNFTNKKCNTKIYGTGCRRTGHASQIQWYIHYPRTGPIAWKKEMSTPPKLHSLSTASVCIFAICYLKQFKTSILVHIKSVSQTCVISTVVILNCVLSYCLVLLFYYLLYGCV